MGVCMCGCVGGGGGRWVGVKGACLPEVHVISGMPCHAQCLPTMRAVDAGMF